MAGDKGAISGAYLEARTAEVFAGGCVMNSEAGTAGRHAVLAWKIDQGSFNGIALDGLSVVAAIAADRNLGINEIGGNHAQTKAAVYVDTQATSAQQNALIAMATELSGGIVGTVVKVTPAPIMFTDTAHRVRVSTSDIALDVNKHLEHDLSCGGMQWFQPLSSVSQATIGMATSHMFTGSSLGTKWSDPDKRSAFFGTFSY
tara:strand:- start:1288 stop:1893 length:606 start_codon:yes stop_codon:yes gene_type:complete